MGIVRGLITLILLAAFIALTIWVWSRRNQSAFEAAARLPLDDDMPQHAPALSPINGEKVKSRELSK
jgi:cytochrome c oxidase cbb3-type subunit IV